MTAYEQFQDAARVYATDPNPSTLLYLNRRALRLMDCITASPEPCWESIDSPGARMGDFSQIRIICDRRLCGKEVCRLSGCLGYALRAMLAGEDLSDPKLLSLSDGERTFSVLEYFYDATKSRRSDPDHEAVFELAREMIFVGTPVRQTSRAGWGTKGTRLVEGIARCNLAFYVR